KLADSIANAQIAANIEPIGLAGYHGLKNVTRLGDPKADKLRQPADFYSPNTFNYNVLDVSADGKTLTVTSYGIHSTVQNGFVEYDPENNPEQVLFSFEISVPNAADLNGDGAVNGLDLGILLGAWGTPAADLNGDGTTDAADLAILLGAWTG